MTVFVIGKTLILLGFKLGHLAETGGFEPPGGVKAPTSLAKRLIRPL